MNNNNKFINDLNDNNMTISYNNAIRGQEFREQLFQDLSDTIDAATILMDIYDEEKYRSMQGKLNMHKVTKWIGNIIVEPIQRQNAWVQSDIIKLLD
jgi:hypothetical protein